MVAKKKQKEVESNPIFYTLDPELYKTAKMDLLSSKSSVLISRNYALKCVEYCQQEEIIKIEIKKILNKIAFSLREMKAKLPVIKIPKEEKKVDVVEKKQESKQKEEKVDLKTEIDSELDAINEKLRQLGAI